MGCWKYISEIYISLGHLMVTSFVKKEGSGDDISLVQQLKNQQLSQDFLVEKDFLPTKFFSGNFHSVVRMQV